MTVGSAGSTWSGSRNAPGGVAADGHDPLDGHRAGDLFLTHWANALGVWQFPGRLQPAPSDEAKRTGLKYDHMDFHPDRTAVVVGQPSTDGLRMNWPNPISSRVDLSQRRGWRGVSSTSRRDGPSAPRSIPGAATRRTAPTAA